MYQLEIVLSGAAILISVYISLNNLFRRFRFNLNKTLALIAFLSAVEFTLILLHLLGSEIIPLVWKGRIFIALILYMMQLLFHLIHIYPDKKVMPVLWFFLITGTPGFVFTLITIFTDLVIKDVTTDNFVTFQAGNYMPLFLILIVFYLIAIIYVIIQKFRESATRALSQDLINFLAGFIISFIIMLVSSFILPHYFGIDRFRITGICISSVIILLILNYGVFDYSALNFKKFYFTITSWVIIFIVLTIPIYLFIKYRNIIIPESRTAVAGVSLLIFIFQFIFLNFLKSKADNLYNREFNKLSEIFTDFFTFSTQITASDELSTFWESLYNRTINSFETKFGINSASLYIYDSEKKVFSFIYGYGDMRISEPLTTNSAIVRSLSLIPGVLKESMLHSNIIYAEHKEKALAFMSSNNIRIAMAFVNDDNEIFAILFLSPLPKNRIYSRTFLEVLETYRQKLQHQLLNGLILEDIRREQINEHDSILIDLIKKRIIPHKLKQVKGVSLSSLNINISQYGGDYYDTLKVNENKLCLFISDTSYSGVDSSILALEQYSVFHSQSGDHLTPHQIMNVMNWVISTSEYNLKESPAFCMTITSKGEIEYCNGAFNPPVIYDTNENSFSEYSTEGIPLGTDKDYTYESKRVRIKSGSILFLYSDGISSALNKEGESYSVDRIKDIVLNNNSDSPHLMVRKIYQDLTGFVSGMKQNNDISLVLLRLD